MCRALFTGTATALATPFSSGSVDTDALSRLIDFQLEHRVDALVVCGTTGEAPVLTQSEKDSILSLALERTNGRIPVIMGAGGNNTCAVIAAARRAQALGASGILSVTPYYNRPGQRGLIAHYSAVADALDIPLILYNVPSRTGVNLLPETAARLSEHPRICGIKEAGGSISQAADLMHALDGRIPLYCGNDDQVLPMLALGGSGVISAVSNVIPGLMRSLTQAWALGNAAHARTLQLRILPLCRALFADTNPVPLKAALALMGLCPDELRLPLVGADAALRTRIEQELRQLELTESAQPA